MSEALEWFKIVLACVLAAIVYGVLHDQITARICVEYFTIGHPPVFATEDPTLLGLGWGVIATWWVGLILGIGLAGASRLGKRPKRTLAESRAPIAILLASMAVIALLAGLIGNAAARSGGVVLVGPLASEVPEAAHVGFIADLWAHLASYISGFLGGVVVLVWTWRQRKPDSSAAPVE